MRYKPTCKLATLLSFAASCISPASNHHVYHLFPNSPLFSRARSSGEEAPANQRRAPTASFGILSIDAYRKSLSEEKRQSVVVKYATLNLITMRADERYNSPAKFDEVLNTIQTLVPYFTRDFLVAYAARFLDVPKGSAWDLRGVRSSTSIFVSQLRTTTRLGSREEEGELILDMDKHDFLYKKVDRSNFRLPKRPKTCVGEGMLSPPMDYSFREYNRRGFHVLRQMLSLGIISRKQGRDNRMSSTVEVGLAFAPSARITESSARLH